MGRELRRVPLDFAWPLGMVWKGYLNPFHAQKCKPCDGSGESAETKRIADDFYDFEGTGRRWSDAVTQDEVDALIAANRLWGFWRRCGPNGWEDIEPRPVVTAAMVNAANAPWSRGYHSHDAINRCILIETRAKRLGVWGKCTWCDGDGEIWQSVDVRALHEAWRPTPPPDGPGYQLWETMSEGSPQSPVFATLDELCAWLEDGATIFGDDKITADAWRAALGGGVVAGTDGTARFSGVGMTLCTGSTSAATPQEDGE